MIYAFYSYKGGVGRSMALANVAELLWRAGLKVLMVDWDLEAPGLEEYFTESIEKQSIKQREGIIEMLVDFKAKMTNGFGTVGPHTLPFRPVQEFLVQIYPPETEKGSLWLLPPGRRDSEHLSRYVARVLEFDWLDFYQRWGGELYIEWLRQQLHDAVEADVVLIDSRTGITEMGGVCVYQLADTVVMFCSPYQQSLEGTYQMARSLTHPEVERLRGGRPLNILIVPARIERAESEQLSRFREEFFARFKDFVPRAKEIDFQQLWRASIPYVPKYAFTESLAVRDRDRASAQDIMVAFRRLCRLMMQMEERLTALWTHRRKAVRQRTVFLAHSSRDKPFVTRLANDLKAAGVSIWLDVWEIRVGDSILQKIEQGLAGSEFLAIVLSPDSVDSLWVREELNAALIQQLESRQVLVLPVLYRDCEIPSFLKDKRYADFREGNYQRGLQELLEVLVLS